LSKILFAEDDRDVADNVSHALRHNQHTCETAFNGRDAFELACHFEYDLLIIDWEMPEMSGLEVVREYRSRGGNAPVLMLTGRTAVASRVEGLDAGADDYLTKPFHLSELMARVRALLRRPTENQGGLLSLGNLSFDTIARKLLIDGREVELSALELQVMEYFMRRPSSVVLQNDLINRVWSSESCATENAVYSCIKSLRKKIAGSEETPVISTVYGLGYRLELKGGAAKR
jgi:DNA-binding response OmpR family regulator